MSSKRTFAFLATLVLLFSALPSTATENADLDFSADYERIFQIRVVSNEAGGKSSIGSGFLATDDGLLVTNYHVVSDYISSPREYEIKYVTHTGEIGGLELVDFDVISDLAVLQHPSPEADFIKTAPAPLEKGQVAYALGNPGDWGIIMVPGPTNGFVEHSYESRVLFSGSLNGGMSGGPSLNSLGELVGVNVATAGSQLSFLVPVSKVSALLARNKQLSVDSYQAEIATQIKAWQRLRIQDLVDAQWPREDFAERILFGEIRKDFQCWGDTNESDEERHTARVEKTCETGDDIYLGYDLNAGQIRFSFSDLRPVKLTRPQFARNAPKTYLSSVNSSEYKHSTNFECHKDFIQAKNTVANSYQRIVTCVRAYKELPGLYDSMLLIQDHRADRIFEAFLSVSALEPDQIQLLNKRFVEMSL